MITKEVEMDIAYREKDGTIFILLRKDEIEHMGTYVEVAACVEKEEGKSPPPREEIVGVDETSGRACLKFSFLHRDFATTLFELLIAAYREEGKHDESDRLYNTLRIFGFFQGVERLN